LILQFNTIKDRCHFVFIPGPQDTGVVKIYPRWDDLWVLFRCILYSIFLIFSLFKYDRPGILPHHTEYIRKKIPNCHFASNPCRIQFGSRQIVVFREDVLQKMNRNAIKIPDPEKITEDVWNCVLKHANKIIVHSHIFF